MSPYVIPLREKQQAFKQDSQIIIVVQTVVPATFAASHISVPLVRDTANQAIYLLQDITK